MGYRYDKLLIIAIAVLCMCLFYSAKVLAATEVELVSSLDTAEPGEVVYVNVLAKNFTDLYSAELHLQYNPLILQAVDEAGNSANKAIEGDVFTNSKFVAKNSISPETGKIDYAVTFLGNVDGKSGTGCLLKQKFKILKKEASEIQCTEILLINKDLEYIPFEKSGVVINVASRNSGSIATPTGTGSTTDNGGTGGGSSGAMIPSSVITTTPEIKKPPVDSRVVDAFVKKFTDMQGHWAEEAVSSLAKQKLINGYDDGTFKPDKCINRAEIAVLFTKSFDLKPVADGELVFTDSSSIPEWARSYVSATANAGLIKGFPQPDGSFQFDSDRFISRAEFAALAARIMEKTQLVLPTPTLAFSDAGDIPEWARQATGMAVAAKIIAGYPDNTFQASKNINRAEAALIISRLLDLTIKK